MGYREFIDETLYLLKNRWDSIKDELVFKGSGKKILEEVAKLTPYKDVAEFRTDEAMSELILTAYMLGRKESLEEVKRIWEGERNEKNR